MRFFSIYRTLCATTNKPNRPRRCRLSVESLEERLVPSSTTITVTNLTDTTVTGETNLRQAIAVVDSSTSATTYNIVFANSGTIKLTQGEPAIDPTNAHTVVNITGNSGGTIIDGGGKSRIFGVDESSGNTTSLTLTNLTLQNGSATVGGASTSRMRALSLSTATPSPATPGPPRGESPRTAR